MILMNVFQTLIIDDHPLITNAYKQSLVELGKRKEINMQVETVSSIDEYIEFENSNSIEKIKLVILDISLPIGENKEILSGEDIGIRLRKRFPEIKIIISTTFNDNYRVHSILKNIDPDGFLVKSDLTPKELIYALDNIIDEPPYYSSTVLKLMRKHLSNDMILDDMDRKLIYELSLGTKMKNIPKVLPLSIAGIEKRKRNLKILFNIEGEGDSGLIRIAREKGFI